MGRNVGLRGSRIHGVAIVQLPVSFFTPLLVHWSGLDQKNEIPLTSEADPSVMLVLRCEGKGHRTSGDSKILTGVV